MTREFYISQILGYLVVLLYSRKKKEQKVEKSFITQVEKIILQECGLK